MQNKLGSPPTQNILIADANALVDGDDATKAASYAADTANISPIPIRIYDGACHNILICWPVLTYVVRIIISTTNAHNNDNNPKNDPIANL